MRNREDPTQRAQELTRAAGASSLLLSTMVNRVADKRLREREATTAEEAEKVDSDRSGATDVAASLHRISGTRCGWLVCMASVPRALGGRPDWRGDESCVSPRGILRCVRRDLSIHHARAVVSARGCRLGAAPRPAGEGRALPRGKHWPRGRAPLGRKPRVSAHSGCDRSAGTRSRRRHADDRPSRRKRSTVLGRSRMNPAGDRRRGGRP